MGQHLEETEKATRTEYFANIAAVSTPDFLPDSAVVTHLLSDRPFFVEGLQKVSNVRALYPKPKSIDADTKIALSTTYNIRVLDRKSFSDTSFVINELASLFKDRDFVLLDVGGYFASSLPNLVDHFGPRLLGVVEDTENGHQKYMALGRMPCPVVSVARSPLKNPEDYLVGQAVAFSIDALLREHGDILHGRSACVIGYGKIGRSIAHILHAKRVSTVVFDTDPARCVEAMSHGYRVPGSIDEALDGTGLVVGATGNMSMSADRFEYLSNGCYVATVTSSDDELDLSALKTYRKTRVTEYLTRYARLGHFFYLLNHGNAVNFIHGAHVGPFIFLVQAELIVAASLVAQGVFAGSTKIESVNDDIRKRIAEIWRKYFTKNGFCLR